jgi:hypothetical protein
VVSLPFVARLAFIAAALLAAAPVEAQAQRRPSNTPYGTAVFGAANEYCGLVESGMNPAQAWEQALEKSTKTWGEYTRNNPQGFAAAVHAEATRQCVPKQTPAQEAAQFCPGLSTAQMARIASGARLAVIWPGCHMEFN